MKIRSITLDGFWGYREGVQVDIAGLNMLVAVGHNGSGKSALIVNGVIAGLYGKFPTRTVEESITVGANTGTVIVEFEVGGSVYRVARAHQRSGAATASVHRLADGEWEAVTEKGVREATAKVTEILGMNYETAVMTWIAEQGKYDAFATAQPAARFKMLASVFDLAKYGPMHRAAQETLRKAKDAVSVATGRVAELNDDLVDDDFRAQSEMSDDALAAAAASAHDTFDDASKALAAHQQNDPQVAVRHARTALAAVKDLRLERLAGAEQALEELRAARAAAPVARDEANAAAHERFEREKAMFLDGINRSRQQGTSTIATADAELTRINQAIADQGALAADVARLEVATERLKVAANAREQDIQARTHEAHNAESALRAARVAFGEAQDAMEALAHAGDCYACGQHISETVAAHLRATHEEVLASRGRAVAEAQEAHLAAEKAVDDALASGARADAADDVVWEQLSAARLAVHKGETLAADAARARATIDQEQQRLLGLDTEELSMVSDLEAERDERLRTAYAACESNLADIAARGKQAAAAVNEHRRPSAEEERLERDLTAAENIANGDSRYEAEAQRLTAARDAARAQATSYDAEIGRRAEIARRQAEFETRIAAAKADLATAENDVTVHSELVSAYAPGGIPSMILETVIGDLNDAINVTLAELSGGELEVRLTTARETSGGTAESKVTVYVDTPTGARAYEALSGGQRFRVDLAIRTGLAAIVARGTGTPIETFILDEGWGSLDEAGIRSTLGVLGRLAEQTNVLTVSHVDTVRDAFPARIEVSTDEGTSAAVVVR